MPPVGKFWDKCPVSTLDSVLGFTHYPASSISPFPGRSFSVDDSLLDSLL